MNIQVLSSFGRTCSTYLRSSLITQSRSYRSGASLSNLYPDSTEASPKDIKVDAKSDEFSGYIPIEKLEIGYSRSSGPGGQNVNKVSTKVDVRFKVETADWLPKEMKTNILENHKSALTASGHLIARSERTRSQQLNLADALDKLRTRLHSFVSEPPKEKDHHTLEVLRRRHEKSNRERLRVKKEKSLVKQFRGAM